MAKIIATETKFDKLIKLAKHRGFFFPAAEIYGGPAGYWDYGPLGTTLKRKIIDTWRETIVSKDNMIEIDGAQILPPAVFRASGHLTSFQDPITICTKCKAVYRADKLIEDKTKKNIPEALGNKKYDQLIKDNKIVCPSCKGKLSPAKMSNLMLKILQGLGHNEENYLRPETCQSIFLAFKRTFRTSRAKLPVGIAQVGKAFRNEISPRQAIFRAREFTQAESEIFFNPKKENEFKKFNSIKKYKLRLKLLKNSKTQSMSCTQAVKKKIVSGKLVAYYLALTQQFFEALGFQTANFRFRQVGKDERAFYAKETWDFEIKTSLGWTELVANNYRSDYDLKCHQKGSKENLSVLDDQEKVLPFVWEISIGIDRILFSLLDNAYNEETVKGQKRTVLNLSKKIAPITVAVFPLSKKKSLPELAKKICAQLANENINAIYDEAGSIGKRYRRHDEIGTPYCITVDFDSLKKKDVTIRDRDTMKQKRAKIKTLTKLLK